MKDIAYFCTFCRESFRNPTNVVTSCTNQDGALISEEARREEFCPNCGARDFITIKANNFSIDTLHNLQAIQTR